MLKVENWPYTDPVVSQLYGRPPLIWKDMTVQLVVYETELENVARVIPEPLEQRTNLVITWVSEFRLGTTQGAFAEAAIYVQVKLGTAKATTSHFCTSTITCRSPAVAKSGASRKRWPRWGCFTNTRPSAARSTA